MKMKEKGMQKKVYIVIAAVAVVAIAALALMLTAGRKEDVYRSIKIIELEGGVTIEREGVGVLAASSNMNLISGDAVKTDQDAYAVLQLDSDKYVMLAESGSMTVVAEGNEANSRTAIHLEAGSVLSEIQNPLSSGSSYDIVTPNATMSVRGTVFEVRRNEGDSTGNIEVLVYDGKVAVGLDSMEPALYEAGEYTQFTSEENPQFIVERTEITEEVLNQQILERLQQIDSSDRELNLGTARLETAQSVASAEPSPTAAPVQTAAPATPAPSATPAVTPAPVKTPSPQPEIKPSSTPAPEAVASPSPAVEEPDDDDDDDQPAQNPDENHNNGGNSDNSQYQDFWKTYSIMDYKQTVSDGNAAAECRVVYYLPYVVKAVDNGTSIISTMRNDAPAVHASVKVAAGSYLTAPETPVGRVDYQQDMPLTLTSWCLEDGTIWHFGVDEVQADMCLYPVWTDGAGKCYFPVICRSAEAWGHYYYCNSIKEGSCLDGITLPDSGSAFFQGWVMINNGTHTGMWKMATDQDPDTVNRAESLKASWSSN